MYLSRCKSKAFVCIILNNSNYDYVITAEIVQLDIGGTRALNFVVNSARWHNRVA